MRDPKHRVRGRPAPVAGERLPLRRPDPAGQHDARGRGHRHQHPAGPALPERRHPGAGHPADRRVEERLRDRPGDRREAGDGRAVQRRTTVRDLQKMVFDNMRMEELIDLGGVRGEEVLRLLRGRGLGERPARLQALLRGPEGQPAADADGQAGVLLRAPGQALPGRQGAAALPEVDREGRDPRRAALEREGRHVPAAHHVEPPALAHARPGRRHHLDQGDAHLQGARASTATGTNPSGSIRPTPRSAASRTATSSRSSTSAASCSCGARVWERIMPGVVYVDHGARHDPIVPGKVDRGGAINTIAPNGITSKNAVRPGYERLPGRRAEGQRRRMGRVAPGLSGGLRQGVRPGAPGCASTPGSREAWSR